MHTIEGTVNSQWKTAEGLRGAKYYYMCGAHVYHTHVYVSCIRENQWKCAIRDYAHKIEGK